MKASVHIRQNRNYTNFRSLHIAEGLRQAGVEIVELDRADRPPKDVELVIQTGFHPSEALKGAIDREIPFIIGECPHLRHKNGMGPDTWVSWGYNGMTGGAWHPKPPHRDRWMPRLEPMKTEGPTIIFGQKPNDRSLRGTDHCAWIEKKLIEYPDAEFRAHPLMTMYPHKAEPLIDCLRRCYHAVTFNSTAGAEALVEGCVSYPEDKWSTAYNVTDREYWLQDLMWQNFSLPDMVQRSTGQYILSGFEEARDRIRNGEFCTPRLKMEAIHTYGSKDPRVYRWEQR